MRKCVIYPDLGVLIGNSRNEPKIDRAVCGRNQFFAFESPTSGTIRNNITDECLTYDSHGKLGSLEPCGGDAYVLLFVHFCKRIFTRNRCIWGRI